MEFDSEQQSPPSQSCRRRCVRPAALCARPGCERRAVAPSPRPSPLGAHARRPWCCTLLRRRSSRLPSRVCSTRRRTRARLPPGRRRPKPARRRPQGAAGGKTRVQGRGEAAASAPWPSSRPQRAERRGGRGRRPLPWPPPGPTPDARVNRRSPNTAADVAAALVEGGGPHTGGTVPFARTRAVILSEGASTNRRGKW